MVRQHGRWADLIWCIIRLLMFALCVCARVRAWLLICLQTFVYITLSLVPQVEIIKVSNSIILIIGIDEIPTLHHDDDKVFSFNYL